MRLLALILALMMPTLVMAGPNFTGSDATIVQLAENCRIQSAVFWTGRPLEGNWYTPCPIDVSYANNNGSGKTTFSIEGGEVYGWKMHVEGPREVILQDVIPHEVDHTVRASLLRANKLPPERWLDEGCATLAESGSFREKQRQSAKQYARDFTPEMLNLMDYPQDTHSISVLYICGFSFCEYLYDLGGAEKLLELQRRPDRTSCIRRLERIYQRSCVELLDEWRAGLRQDYSVAKVDGGPELLEVVTNMWCPACRMFWWEFEHNRRFRRELLSRYHIHRVPVLSPAQAPNGKIPAFVTARGVINGYQGTDKLLQQLQAQQPPAPPPPKMNVGVVDSNGNPVPATITPQQDGSVVIDIPEPAPEPPPLKSTPSGGEAGPDVKEPPKAEPEKEPTFQEPEGPAVPVPQVGTTGTTPAQECEGGVCEVPAAKPSIPTVAGGIVGRALKGCVKAIGGGLGFAFGGPLGQFLGVSASSVFLALGGWLIRRWWTGRRSRQPKPATVGGSTSSTIPADYGTNNPTTGVVIGPTGGAQPIGGSTSPGTTFPSGDSSTSQPGNSTGTGGKTILPRHLDEARHLLELRQREGRVAVLDSLKGMFADDEVERIMHDSTVAETVKDAFRAFRNRLNARVGEVAPLAVTD